MAPKPSIILVPGSYILPTYYAHFANVIEAMGYEIEVIDLPTVGAAPGQGREGTLPTMLDDVAVTKTAVNRLADQGKDVLLVAHSYGGIPVSQCVEGLSKKARAEQGKRGGIVKIGYITSVVPAVKGPGEAEAAVEEDAPEIVNHPAPTMDVRFPTIF
jgi:predicted alpha/beta hydrolase